MNLYKCASDPEKFITYLENLSKPFNILYTDLKSPLEKWDFYKAVYKKYTRENDFLDNMSFEIGDFEKAAI